MFLNHLGRHSRWNAFHDLEKTLDDLQQVFAPGRAFAPSVVSCPLNVWGDERGLIVTCELPGVDPGSLSIDVLGDTLTISGKRTDGEHDNASDFSRALRLPYRVAAESADAQCRDGVLTIALQRPASELPKTISVKAG
jgi:HSP20 family protein